MDIEANIELSKTFSKKQQFYQDMHKIQNNFFMLEQKIPYLQMQNINSQLIVKLPSISQQRKTYIITRQAKYIINGQFQPQGENSFQKFILYFIYNIPRPNSHYGLIYINNYAESNAFSEFKKVLNTLPIDYLLNLTKIHVLESSFFDRAASWFQFGISASFINNKIINVYNLRELSKSAHLQLDFLYKILPNNVANYYYKSEAYLQKEEKIQENTFVMKNAKQSSKSSRNFPQNQLNFFKSDKLIKLNEQNFKTNKYYQIQEDPLQRQISEYQTGQNGAPLIFQTLIDMLKNNQNWLKQQGIFRKSVSIDDQKYLTYQLNKGNYNYLSEITDPHLIASAIKKFMYNLRSPIIPYNLFQEIMNQENQSKLAKIIVERIGMLPKVNQMTIFVLFDFLKNKVAPYSQYNKMGESNLCIVFGPCLMKSPQPGSLKELIYAKKIIAATGIILRQLNNIFFDKTIQSKQAKSIPQRNSLTNKQMLDLIKSRRSKKQISSEQIQQFNQRILY